MAISTNSIIHYTSSIDRLQRILAEGFRVKYCLERTIVKGGAPVSGAFPMICFCDIPLSEAKKHLESYGYYGLGLSKTWAKSNGLNPVLYLDQSADIGPLIRSQIFRTRNSDGKYDEETAFNFTKLCSFLKNYEGELIRGGEHEPAYRFYDEREWRYVPLDLKGKPNGIASDKYLQDKDNYNESIKDQMLVFTPQDISYIIIKKDEEVPIITRHLRNIYDDRCSALQLELLLTKIITATQVIEDF